MIAGWGGLATVYFSITAVQQIVEPLAPVDQIMTTASHSKLLVLILTLVLTGENELASAAPSPSSGM